MFTLFKDLDMFKWVNWLGICGCNLGWLLLWSAVLASHWYKESANGVIRWWLGLLLAGIVRSFSPWKSSSVLWVCLLPLLTIEERALWSLLCDRGRSIRCHAISLLNLLMLYCEINYVKPWLRVILSALTEPCTIVHRLVRWLLALKYRYILSLLGICEELRVLIPLEDRFEFSLWLLCGSIVAFLSTSLWRLSSSSFHSCRWYFTGLFLSQIIVCLFDLVSNFSRCSFYWVRCCWSWTSRLLFLGLRTSMEHGRLRYLRILQSASINLLPLAYSPQASFSLILIRSDQCFSLLSISILPGVITIASWYNLIFFRWNSLCTSPYFLK